MNDFFKGFSESSGGESPCEASKKRIERRIIGTDFPEVSLEYDQEDESDIRYIEEQINVLSYMDCEEDTALGTWMKEIVDEVGITVQEDDGDRDNIMMNKDFATHFLRLCKLLPLWSAISCNVFSSPTKTSSSANVESYFKDVKLVLKDILPAKADHFLHCHMDSVNDLIITASQKYATLIDVTITEKSQDSSEMAKINDSPQCELSIQESQELLNKLSFEEAGTNTTEIERDDQTPDKTTAKGDEDNIGAKQSGSNECIACSQGNFPTGAHTCAKCSKNVHIFPECSVAINEEEGYGTKRLCISCHMKLRKISQSRDKKAMNEEDVWGPKKSSKKQSYYLKPNPSFDLMSDTKKSKIGLLKNGMQYTTPKKIDGESIYFSNTCAFDALAHALAGAYANYPFYRTNMDDLTKSDALMGIAIELAKKYEF